MQKPTISDSHQVSLADEEGVKKILVQSVFSLWDVVNNLTKLRPQKRPYYRVSIFGSARTAPGTPEYNKVKDLAAALAALGCDIITGGGPGMMQAANEGAMLADSDNKCRSMGINIALPFEQSVNQFVEKSFEHQTFFTRLHHFVLASDAFIVVPGGIGTVLETLMVWQLLQVNHLPPTPLVLIGEMYKELITWAEEYMLREGSELVSPEDLRIPQCVTEPMQAVEIIREHHANWLRSR